MQMYNGMTNRQRAQVLVEALPYIQKYNGKNRRRQVRPPTP